MDRDGPTDGIDLHHLEKKTQGNEGGTEEMLQVGKPIVSSSCTVRDGAAEAMSSQCSFFLHSNVLSKETGILAGPHHSVSTTRSAAPANESEECSSHC